MAEPDKPKRRRVFFGLVPDEETRAVLLGATRRAVGAAGGRATAPDNLHLTLAFLGGVTDSQLDRARSVPPLALEPFSLTLDRLGFWSQSQILWIGPTRPPEPLLALERDLWTGLVQKRFERERGRFRPHVTLARGARAARAPIRPVRWRVDRLTLLQSVQDPGGVRYATICDWPLAR